MYMLNATVTATSFHSFINLTSGIFFYLQVDDLTKKSIKTAEDICKAKEKEISQG